MPPFATYSWCYGLHISCDLQMQMIQYLVDHLPQVPVPSEFMTWLEKTIKYFESDILYYDHDQIGLHMLDDMLADKFWEKYLKEFGSMGQFADQLIIDQKGMYKVLWDSGQINWLTGQSTAEFPPKKLSVGEELKFEEHIRQFKSEFSMEIQAKFPEPNYFWLRRN